MFAARCASGETPGNTDTGMPFSLDHVWHALPNLPTIFADSAIAALRLGAIAIFVIGRHPPLLFRQRRLIICSSLRAIIFISLTFSFRVAPQDR